MIDYLIHIVRMWFGDWYGPAPEIVAARIMATSGILVCLVGISQWTPAAKERALRASGNMAALYTSGRQLSDAMHSLCIAAYGNTPDKAVYRPNKLAKEYLDKKDLLDMQCGEFKSACTSRQIAKVAADLVADVKTTADAAAKSVANGQLGLVLEGGELVSFVHLCRGLLLDAITDEDASHAKAFMRRTARRLYRGWDRRRTLRATRAFSDGQQENN